VLLAIAAQGYRGIVIGALTKPESDWRAEPSRVVQIGEISANQLHRILSAERRVRLRNPPIGDVIELRLRKPPAP
jgi:hypothetical protein